jgi:hypothetical protein
MPGSYPPAPPTLSGDLLTISRFLQSPTMLSRALRTIMNLRFVSDQLLTNKYRTSGGAISYEISEPILNTRAVTAVAPGSTYPFDTPVSGLAALAAVSKWGEASFLSATRRSSGRCTPATRSPAPYRRPSTRSSTRSRRSPSRRSAAAVTNTVAAGNVWSGASATIFRNVETAAASIIDQNQGYNPDTILMSSTKYALMISDNTVSNLRAREDKTNPIYGGQMTNIGGFNVVFTSVGNLPSDDVWVLDSKLLGGMADEVNNDPGYTTIDKNIQVQSERIAGRDGWNLWARRLTVPIVQEPAAGVKITGT